MKFSLFLKFWIISEGDDNEEYVLEEEGQEDDENPTKIDPFQDMYVSYVTKKRTSDKVMKCDNCGKVITPLKSINAEFSEIKSFYAFILGL